VDLALSHINSYRRRALGGQSPIDLFAEAYGEKTLAKLRLVRVVPNDIVLNPQLLK
jgi:hypothetical protein